MKLERLFLFIAPHRIYLSSTFRDSGIIKIAERVRSCTPREPVRVTLREDSSLHLCTFLFSSRFISVWSIYRGVLIAIACLIKLRHVCSSPIYFVFKITAPPAATMRSHSADIENIVGYKTNSINQYFQRETE